MRDEGRPLPPISPRRREFSILDFDGSGCTEPPSFTEPATLEAMNKLGIVPEELVPLSRDEVARVPGSPSVRAQILAELERRRVDAIDSIRETREELLAAQDRQAAFDSRFRTTSPHRDEDLARLERLQRREVEQLLTVELRRQAMQGAEIARQSRVAASVRVREEMRIESQRQEAERRSQQQAKVLRRIAERDRELDAERERQVHDEIHRREVEAERQAARQGELRRQEVVRQERLRRLEEDREQQRADEMLRRDQREKELKQREEERLAARDAELARVREEHRRLMAVQRGRIAAAQKREEAAIERQGAKIREDDRLARHRMDEHRRQKAATLAAVKQRNEERFRRSQLFTRQLEEEDVHRKSVIEARVDAATARYRTLTAERLRKIEAARSEDNARTRRMEARKRKADELLIARVEEFDRKMEQKELRFEQRKRRQEEEMRDSAALAWCRMRIGDENARRLERRDLYEKGKAIQRIDARTRVVEHLIQTKRTQQDIRARMTMQMNARRKSLGQEVADVMARGGDEDMARLAQRFGIDIDELRKRVGLETPRRQTSE